jgi:hypothetical protein
VLGRAISCVAERDGRIGGICRPAEPAVLRAQLGDATRERALLGEIHVTAGSASLERSPLGQDVFCASFRHS